MAKPKITHERLLEVLDYDPETGIFTWKHRDDGYEWFAENCAGKRAGSIGKKGYRQINVDKRCYTEHRLAWFYVHGEWPNIADHINRQRDDNRIANLRNTTKKMNARNRTPGTIARSGFRGVHQVESGNWGARITLNHRTRRLGTFATPEEASARYEEEARKLFGDFYPANDNATFLAA